MGLDITAYRQLQLAESPELDDDGYPTGDAVKLYVNSNFADRAEGIRDKGVYEFADSMDFRAGSYGGYSAWREELAKLAGYPLTDHEAYGGHIEKRHAAGAWAATEGPFWELINFSDCEGVIGPTVAAKLARDFAEWDDRAKARGAALPFFYEKYQEWHKAMEMAADGGAVDFH